MEHPRRPKLEPKSKTIIIIGDCNAARRDHETEKRRTADGIAENRYLSKSTLLPLSLRTTSSPPPLAKAVQP